MELRDLYNSNKQLTGEVICAGDKIPKDRYYLTVVVWIQNSKGEFLLQLTSPQKKHKWSTTGGHPKAGENSVRGIISEIKEELGVNVDPNSLKLFKTIKTEDDFVDLYYLKSDIDIKAITVQAEEVETVKWETSLEIERLIKNGEFLEEHVEFWKECRRIFILKKNNLKYYRETMVGPEGFEPSTH